jgi:ribosome-binding protein aMBF1 (putative translation factor)
VIELTRQRQIAGITKMELSRRSNVHPSRVTAIELQRAIPRRDGAELIRLATALGFHGDAAELLDPVDETR